MKKTKEKVRRYLALALTVILTVGTMNLTVLPVSAESTSVEAVAVYTGEDTDCYETTSVVIIISRAECVEDEDILFTGEGERAPTCTESGMRHTECGICGDVIRAMKFQS